MFSTFKLFYMNLKIRYKIVLSMLIVSALTSLTIALSCYLFFSNKIIDKANSDIDYSMKVVAHSFVRQLDKIHKDISNISNNEDMINIAKDISSGEVSQFAYNYQHSQDFFDAILKNNELINTIAVLGKNGEFYSTNEIGLRYKNSNMFIWSDEINPMIQWYGVRENPFNPYSNPIVPVFFPTGLNNFGYITFLPPDDDILMNIVVLLDAVTLNTHFEELNKNSLSSMILLDSNYDPLNIPKSSELYTLLSQDQLKRTITDTDQKGRFLFKFNQQSFSITVSPMGHNDLLLVNVISQDELLSSLDGIALFSIVVTIISLVASFCISLFVSFSITTPLNHLVSMVNNIKKGEYPITMITDYKDEVGILNGALSEMSTVILEQMDTIKKDQELITLAEVDILTHQINPHFIYNTLDCIRWEILNNNITGSSQMVESLGNFLRIGLNGSNHATTLKQEIQHVKEYIHIMNNRLGYNIRLITVIEENTLNYSLLKIILQPLVENCIQHAFDEESISIMSEEPTITIEASKSHNNILLTIKDNGKGINIDKAYECLNNTSEKKKHIGLNNVYLRLKAFYNCEIPISFSTIPFYQNSITIQLPIKYSRS